MRPYLLRIFSIINHIKKLPNNFRIRHFNSLDLKDLLNLMSRKHLNKWMIISDKNNSAIRLILPEDSPISELSAIKRYLNRQIIHQSTNIRRKQNICSGIFSFTGNSWLKIISKLGWDSKNHISRFCKWQINKRVNWI